jgi:hypothetical protein
MGGRTLSPRGSRFCENSHTGVNWLNRRVTQSLPGTTAPEALTRPRLPLPVEIPMMVVLTALACFAGYELIRRVPWLRPAFGMKPIPAPARAAPSPAE